MKINKKNNDKDISEWKPPFRNKESQENYEIAL